NSRLPRARPGFDSRPMQLALLLAFLRLNPGQKKDKSLPVGELNPGLPRDRRGYYPLYSRGACPLNVHAACRIQKRSCSSTATYSHFLDVNNSRPVQDGSPIPTPTESPNRGDSNALQCDVKKKRWFIDGVSQTWPFGGFSFFDHSSLLTH